MTKLSIFFLLFLSSCATYNVVSLREDELTIINSSSFLGIESRDVYYCNLHQEGSIDMCVKDEIGNK